MAKEEVEIEREEWRSPGDRGEDPVVLAVQGLSLAFGPNRVLCDINFEVREGEALAIVGQSGSGKSTILKLILRLLVPDAGEIIIQGEDISHLTFEEVLEVRKQMGMVFQASALFDSLSVYENVAYPLREHHPDIPEDDVERRARESLALVDMDLDEFRNRLPAELSGGQRKRVGIARAIVDQPLILLYDEPTSGLDPVTSRTILRMIKRLQRELDVTSIVVTHDVDAVYEVANKVAMLKDCKIIFYGTPQEMRDSEDPVVQEFVA